MEELNLEVSDEILVVAAILGDLEAFEELVIRYRSAVVRLAQTIVGSGDAEDIAQDALLLAFQALPSIENPDRFGAWLMTITRNRALRFSQRNRRLAPSEFSEILLQRLASLTPPLIEEHEDDLMLKQTLEKLPAEYALVLQMRFFDELPLKRISAFLGIPLSTVKWRIHRGKQLFRQLIECSKGELTWTKNKN